MKSTIYDIEHVLIHFNVRLLSFPSFNTETVHELLLSAETVGHDTRLPAESVHMIQLPAVTNDRKHNHTNSLDWKPFFDDRILDSKQEIADSLGGSQI